MLVLIDLVAQRTRGHLSTKRRVMEELLHDRSLEMDLNLPSSAVPSRLVPLPSTEIQSRGNKGN